MFLHEAFLLNFLIMICSQTFAISVESVVGVGSEGSWTSRTIQVARVLSLEFSISDVLHPFSSFQLMDGVFPFISQPISTSAAFATNLAICLLNSDLFFNKVEQCRRRSSHLLGLLFYEKVIGIPIVKYTMYSN